MQPRYWALGTAHCVRFWPLADITFALHIEQTRLAIAGHGIARRNVSF